MPERWLIVGGGTSRGEAFVEPTPAARPQGLGSSTVPGAPPDRRRRAPLAHQAWSRPRLVRRRLTYVRVARARRGWQGIYRALRKGHEDSNDEPGAGDVDYGEMELRATLSPSGAERGTAKSASTATNPAVLSASRAPRRGDELAPGQLRLRAVAAHAPTGPFRLRAARQAGAGHSGGAHRSIHDSVLPLQLPRPLMPVRNRGRASGSAHGSPPKRFPPSFSTSSKEGAPSTVDLQRRRRHRPYRCTAGANHAGGPCHAHRATD